VDSYSIIYSITVWSHVVLYILRRVDSADAVMEDSALPHDKHVKPDNSPSPATVASPGVTATTATTASLHASSGLILVTPLLHFNLVLLASQGC